MFCFYYKFFWLFLLLLLLLLLLFLSSSLNVSFIISLVKLFSRHTFAFFQRYLNELIAYKQQACWWARNHSLYLYFVFNKFLFKAVIMIVAGMSVREQLAARALRPLY